MFSMEYTQCNDTLVKKKCIIERLMLNDDLVFYRKTDLNAEHSLELLRVSVFNSNTFSHYNVRLWHITHVQSSSEHCDCYMFSK